MIEIKDSSPVRHLEIELTNPDARLLEKIDGVIRAERGRRPPQAPDPIRRRRSRRPRRRPGIGLDPPVRLHLSEPFRDFPGDSRMRTISGIGGMWLVARRELRERGRSKSFIISCVVTLLLVGAALVMPQLLGGEAATHQIGVVGEGNEPIVQAAQDLAIADADEGRRTRAVSRRFEYASRRGGESRRSSPARSIWSSSTGTTVLQERTGFSGNGLVDTLQRAAGSVRLQRLVEENGQAAADVIDILSSSPLEVRSLDGEDPEGDIRPADRLRRSALDVHRHPLLRLLDPDRRDRGEEQPGCRGAARHSAPMAAARWQGSRDRPARQSDSSSSRLASPSSW